MKRNKTALLVLVLVWICYHVNAQEDIEKEFPFKIGNLRMKFNYITYNQITNKQIVTDSLKIFNDWAYPMKIEFLNPPEYMRCVALPQTLAPRQEGWLIITMDAPKRKDYGFLYDRLTLNTSDSMNMQKAINVSVYIKEDFSHLTPLQLENAPKVAFNTEKYNFGTVKDGSMVNFSFEFTNEGNDDLIIRKTRASCGCTATQPEKTLLKKGETSRINITFNTSNRTGPQHKTINVITNDPNNSDITLHIEGNVTKE